MMLIKTIHPRFFIFHVKDLLILNSRFNLTSNFKIEAMYVKGTAVKSIQEYVQTRHSDKYTEWLRMLPEPSRNIMSKPIYVSDWYSIKDAALEPTIALGKLAFEGDSIKAAWETGRFSSESALNGVYKIFVKMATPQFIIGRSGKILPSYYDPSDIAVKETGPKHVILTISRLPSTHEVLEARISGWIQKALEVTGCKNVKIDPTKSMTKGDSITELKISWD